MTREATPVRYMVVNLYRYRYLDGVWECAGKALRPNEVRGVPGGNPYTVNGIPMYQVGGQDQPRMVVSELVDKGDILIVGTEVCDRTGAPLEVDWATIFPSPRDPEGMWPTPDNS